MQSPHASNRIHGFARFHALTFLVILGLSALVSIAPNVAAQACSTVESFDSFDFLDYPEPCAYTNLGSTTGTTYVATAESVSGPNSYYMENGAELIFDTGNPLPDTQDETITLSANFRTPTLPEVSKPLDISNDIGCDDVAVCLRILNTGEIRCSSFTPFATFSTVWAVNTWYSVVLTIKFDQDRDGAGPDLNELERVSCTVQNIGTGVSETQILQVNNYPTSGGFWDNSGVIWAGTVSTTFDFYVDDVFHSQAIGEVLTPTSLFCADPSLGSAADWGYDYKEDTEFDTDLTANSNFDPTFDLEDGFLMLGDDGDQAYLGKAFTPGTQAVRQVARIEAGADATDSIVRLAFTTGAATLSEGASGDGAGDMTSAGNGQNTGNFEDQIQAVLQEDDDQWVVSIKYTSAGGSLTQILGSANYGANPNTPHTFSFIVNTGTTTITGPLLDSQEHTIFTGSIAPGKAQLRGEAGTIIERDIPAGLASAEWKDSWVITTGSSGVFTAGTVLDDNTDAGQTDDSTCIFDLLGTATVVGSSGSSPGSFIVVPEQEAPTACTAIFCPPAEGVGGISASALSLFLGIVIVASFAASMSQKTGSGAAGIAIFALLGLFVAYALGYIQLWVIVSLTVMGVAAIFLGIRNGSQGAGM